MLFGIGQLRLLAGAGLHGLLLLPLPAPSVRVHFMCHDTNPPALDLMLLPGLPLTVTPVSVIAPNVAPW